MVICVDEEQREALRVAGHLNAAHIELVGLVRRLDETAGWAVDGCRSLQHWLTWQLGLSGSEAARAVRVAAAVETHPVLTGMFLAGRLSMAQVALAVTVDPTRDGELAEVAVACTLSQLRVFVAAMRRCDRSRPAEEVEPRRERVEWSFDHDGWLMGRFELDADHGRVVAAALEQCRDALFHDQRSDPPADGDVEREVLRPDDQPGRVRWCDALVELAHRGLDSERSVGRRDRYRVNLFVDLDHLTHDDTRDGGLPARWLDRSPVPSWLAGRIGCDATVTPTLVRGARPVSVGRSQRIVPERTRRLVVHRDGNRCRVPWCNRSRWLDVHHIVAWADGGLTDTENLMAVCGHCHTAIHQGYIVIAGDADDPLGLVFRDRFRRVITLHPQPPPGQPPPAPPEPPGDYEHPWGERLQPGDVWVNPTRIAS